MGWNKCGTEGDVAVVDWHVASPGRYSRFAGLIQVRRPHWSARDACRAASVLRGKGVSEFREVGVMSDYMNYLESQLTYYRQDIRTSHERLEECEMEVAIWANYWRRYCGIA